MIPMVQSGVQVPFGVQNMQGIQNLQGMQHIPSSPSSSPHGSWTAVASPHLISSQAQPISSGTSISVFCALLMKFHIQWFHCNR